MMKRIIYTLMIMVLIFSFGCNAEVASDESSGDDVSAEPQGYSYQDVIDECNSLCDKDADAFCTEERTIAVDGAEITGTCRGFSKKGNVEGFERCTRFCRDYDRAGTEIKTVGQK